MYLRGPLDGNVALPLSLCDMVTVAKERERYREEKKDRKQRIKAGEFFFLLFM